MRDAIFPAGHRHGQAVRVAEVEQYRARGVQQVEYPQRAIAGDEGVRLGYGGGFYDRTLAALKPRPYTVGIGYGHGYVPWLEAEPHDMPLDAMITEDGVFWERERD